MREVGIAGVDGRALGRRYRDRHADAVHQSCGIPHSGEAGPDGATVLDVFSPVRSDRNDTPRLAVTKRHWS
jgi:hypothetical protein